MNKNAVERQKKLKKVQENLKLIEMDRQTRIGKDNEKRIKAQRHNEQFLRDKEGQSMKDYKQALAEIDRRQFLKSQIDKNRANKDF